MMQDGALALIDCLGFKGIWKRVADPEALLDTLKAMPEGVSPSGGI